jgi:UDP-N-acetyl-D-glucosamine dehydrogenase
MEVLAERGAELSYHDPYVPSLPDLGLQNEPLDAVLAEADATVLVTAHPGVDYLDIASRSNLFIDLRGLTRKAQPALVQL